MERHSRQFPCFFYSLLISFPDRSFLYFVCVLLCFPLTLHLPPFQNVSPPLPDQPRSLFYAVYLLLEFPLFLFFLFGFSPDPFPFMTFFELQGSSLRFFFFFHLCFHTPSRNNVFFPISLLSTTYELPRLSLNASTLDKSSFPLLFFLRIGCLEAPSFSKLVLFFPFLPFLAWAPPPASLCRFLRDLRFEVFLRRGIRFLFPLRFCGR